MADREPIRQLALIEAARGVAACLVVFYHVARHFQHSTGQQPFDNLFQFGHAAVDFFFVLSGFVIFLVHTDDIGRKSATRGYVYRRLIRIYPIFWVAWLLFLVPLLLKGELSQLSGPGMLLDMLLLPAGSIVDVSWSLRHEIIFYGAFLLLILHRALGMLAVSGWMLLILAGATYWPAAAELPILGSPHNLQFFMGAGVALLLRRPQTTSMLPDYAWNLCLLAGLGGFAFTAALENGGVIDGYDLRANLLYGAASSLIIAGLVAVERRRPVPLPRFMLYLGSTSYSIYLVHILGIGVANQLLTRTGLLEQLGVPLSFAVMVAGGIGAGVVVGLLIELPMLRLLRRYAPARLRRSADGAPCA